MPFTIVSSEGLTFPKCRNNNTVVIMKQEISLLGNCYLNESTSHDCSLDTVVSCYM